MTGDPMLLSVNGLAAGYGAGRVLDGVDFALAPGQTLAVLGRNGAGKTTLLKSLLGLTQLQAGHLLFAGQDMTRWPPERRAVAGVGWVPQERAIFRSLTVFENLAAVARPGAWTPARVLELFPKLAARRHHKGDQLSGGEQQMLALGRALTLNPRLLLLDEPTEGLAPVIVEEVMAALRRIFTEEGMAGIIVDQHAQRILRLTDTALVLERGRIAFSGPSTALSADPLWMERLLGVGHAAS